MINTSTNQRKSKPQVFVQEALKADLIIHSCDLFGEQGRLVMIQHAQDWYRLMITKQGKLILTK